MQTCAVCGKQNPPGVEYCEDCGAALKTSSQQTAGTSDAGTGADATVSSPAGAAKPEGGPGGSAPEAVSTSTAASPAPATTAPEQPRQTDTAPPQAGATPQPAAGRPRLLLKRFGAPTGDEIPLMADRLVVGRFDPETGPVDIDLSSAAEAEHISRNHGELYREADGRWFVRDLGSTNGVFVKGSGDTSFGPRITAPRELSDGDEVAFGNARMVFRTT